MTSTNNPETTKSPEERVIELEELLENRNSEISSLKNELGSLSKEIEQLTSLNKRDKDRAHIEYDSIVQEKKSLVGEMAHNEEVARIQIRQLRLQLSGRETLQQENQQLRKRIYSLLNEFAELSDDYATRYSDMKKDLISAQLKLENAFRSAVREIDVQHQQKAYNEISEESRNAIENQARVREELAVQTVGMQFFQNRFEQQTKLLKQRKIDRDILEQQQNVQNKLLSGLRQQVQTLEAALEEKRAALDTMEQQMPKIEELERRQIELLEINKKLEAELQQVTERASKHRITNGKPAVVTKREIPQLEPESTFASNVSGDLAQTLASIGRSPKKSTKTTKLHDRRDHK